MKLDRPIPVDEGSWLNFVHEEVTVCASIEEILHQSFRNRPRIKYFESAKVKLSTTKKPISLAAAAVAKSTKQS